MKECVGYLYDTFIWQIFQDLTEKTSIEGEGSTYLRTVQNRNGFLPNAEGEIVHLSGTTNGVL